jgi:hypothetical protein
MTPGDDAAVEILVRSLGMSPLGELYLFTASTSRSIPATLRIPEGAGAAEPGQEPLRARQGTVAYSPARADPAEILGVVEISVITERGRRR